MWQYLIPRIALKDLLPMFAVATAGGLLAGVYGIAHDQLTYSISREYFTNLKFEQFSYADFGLGDRVFVATIGFLASWWVGFIAGWFLARRLIPDQSRAQAYRQIRSAFVVVTAVGVSFGVAGYFYGLHQGPDADFSSWEWAIKQYRISDTWSFVQVAYIHNASYLGGLIGLIIAIIAIKPRRHAIVDSNRPLTESPGTEPKTAPNSNL